MIRSIQQRSLVGACSSEDQSTVARDAGANPIEDTGVTVDAGGLDATVSATPLMRLRSNLALGMGYGSFTDPRREGGDRKATMSFRKA